MGGHAFGTPCDSVTHEELTSLVSTISVQIGIDFFDRLLGSALLKSVSNDVDLAVSRSEEAAIVKWAEDNSYQHKVLPDMLHIKYPFREKTVQLDFMIGDIKWLKFYYRQDRSQYSGEDRAVLLNLIAKYHNLIESNELDDFGRPAIIQRWKLGNKGLIRVERRSIFVEGRTVKKQRDNPLGDPIMDPAEVAKMLFGDEHADLSSCEAILKLVSDQKIIDEFLGTVEKKTASTNR